MTTMQSHQPSTDFEREIDEQGAWQLRETEAALREADAGDFADEAEVVTFAGRWTA
jgi:predicted transcriptional regulator